MSHNHMASCTEMRQGKRVFQSQADDRTVLGLMVIELGTEQPA
jgi:hypothetical protein